MGYRTDGTYDHDRSFQTFSKQLQSEFDIYIGAQAKLNIYELTQEIWQYASVNDTARDETSVRIVRSDDEEEGNTMV